MTDLPFDIPVVPPSALERARQRYAQAEAAYNEASEAEDEFGDPIPSAVSKEYRWAKQDLARAEAQEIERMKR